jgi:hypothetical protein
MGYMVEPIPNQIPRDQRDTVSGGLYGYDLASYAETERRKGGREALGTSHSILGIPALWGKKKTRCAYIFSKIPSGVHRQLSRDLSMAD